MLNLLLQHDNETLSTLKQKIKNLEAQLSTYDPITQVQPFQKNLKDTITKFEQEIMTGKKTKLQRDKQDYEKEQSERFFSLRHKRHGRRTRRGKRNKKKQATTLSAHARAEEEQQAPEITNNQLQIINLSTYTLSEAERKIVLKALHHKPELFPDSTATVDRRVFHDLLELLNENDDTAVGFLDLRLIRQNDIIYTDLFRKNTAANGLLDFKSFHPHHLKKNLPTGQFHRIRRNCTLQSDFCSQAKALSTRLQARGYPRSIIKNALQQTKSIPRTQLLKPRNRKVDNELRYITTFHNHWKEVSELFRRHWNILKTDPKVTDLVPERPLITARRAPNLRDSLSRSHFIKPTLKLGRGCTLRGMYPCGECNICSLVSRGSCFANPLDGTEYNLKDYMNCKTSNVIYALTCSCPKTYVGQTSQELRKRVQQHISNINCAKQDISKGKMVSTVAMHFLQVHSSNTRDLRVTGLQKIPPNIRRRDRQGELLRLEARWIYQLGSVSPGGLNEDLLYTGFLLP
ncbi:uncharacterized protein [Ranitomeya imitator]|uniref:uncharacterized protein n=1 Tax=Ranitomeya imitator TaxID=111125 RepID=UPI0037E894F6